MDYLEKTPHPPVEKSPQMQSDEFAEEVLNFLASKKFIIPTEKTPSYDSPLNLSDQQAKIFKLLLSSVLGKVRFSVGNILGLSRRLRTTYETTGPIGQPNAPVHAIARLHIIWDKDKQQPLGFDIDGEILSSKHQKVPLVNFMVSQGPIKNQRQVEELWKDKIVMEAQKKRVYQYFNDDNIFEFILLTHTDYKSLARNKYSLIGSINDEHFIYGLNILSTEPVRRFDPTTIIDGVDNYIPENREMRRSIK